MGHRDRLQVWTKPKRRPDGCTKKQWKQLPTQLEVRLVEKQVDIPGFRSEKVVIVTTLLDSIRYPAEELVELYRQRWSVELFFRDIKITLGMDQLDCKTPGMVRKELTMHMICYNLLRGLMQQAALQENTGIERISFKGAAQKLHEWLPVLTDPTQTHAERRNRLKQYYKALTTMPVPDRPNRCEPRVRKRRPKNYRLMTRPRNAGKAGKAA